MSRVWLLVCLVLLGCGKKSNAPTAQELQAEIAILERMEKEASAAHDSSREASKDFLYQVEQDTIHGRSDTKAAADKKNIADAKNEEYKELASKVDAQRKRLGTLRAARDAADNH